MTMFFSSSQGVFRGLCHTSPIIEYSKECGSDRSEIISFSSQEEDSHEFDDYTKSPPAETEPLTSNEKKQPKTTITQLLCILLRALGRVLLASLLFVVSILLICGLKGHSISLDKLVNVTELNLQTNFQIESGKQRLREYEFNITHGLAAPSGVQKKMVLVNGQSPGPLIEANTGDIVRVKVNNHLPDESTAIHWHGIHQRNTTWMDGVTGVSQCGIPPGKTFTYEFHLIDQRGTFWYHAHSKVQYTDGLYGPIVIHDPNELLPPDTTVAAERIIFMGGSFHAYGEDLLKDYLQPSSAWSPSMPGVEPLPDVILINGLAPFTNCNLTSSTWPSSDPPICDPSPLQYTTPMIPSSNTAAAIRLRLINHSSFTSLYFTIDSHPPSPSSRSMASNPILESVHHQGTALLSYPSPSSNTSSLDIRPNPNLNTPQNCTDLPFNLPVPLRAIPAYSVDRTSTTKNTHEITFQFQQAGPVNRIFINRTSWSILPNNAQLWLSLPQSFTGDSTDPGSYNNHDFPLNQQVLLLPDPDKPVQVAINSRDVMEHPFHLHGHTFQIVGWGPGEFAGGSNPNTTWNLENPMRRDTLTIPGLSHVVIRFLADNPGIWALHCHVAWHMEAGMLVTFLERPDDLKHLVHDMDSETRKLSRSFCFTQLGHFLNLFYSFLNLK
ncbi:multicopper oxidase-domain-containing protein [Triangularia verruculosa]|uniref:Multicopper oxidase-domain-containing protein n=1 Tax=Triangularia verruculosa TaxID=2587418 RepID=A0AAN6XR15_9PEZI|nr:multicopper oxidase-domain-containing protein [Triangularia verruculosa]